MNDPAWRACSRPCPEHPDDARPLRQAPPSRPRTTYRRRCDRSCTGPDGGLRRSIDGEDVGGGFGPDEGSGTPVVPGDVASDRGLQVDGAPEGEQAELCGDGLQAEGMPSAEPEGPDAFRLRTAAPSHSRAAQIG